MLALVRPLVLSLPSLFMKLGGFRVAHFRAVKESESPEQRKTLIFSRDWFQWRVGVLSSFFYRELR